MVPHTKNTLENYCSNPPNSVYKGVATNLHHFYTAEFLMQISAPWLWVYRTWCHSEWLLFKKWAEAAPLKDKTAPWNALRSSDQKSRLEAQMVTQCRANIKLWQHSTNTNRQAEEEKRASSTRSYMTSIATDQHQLPPFLCTPVLQWLPVCLNPSWVASKL